MSKTLAILACGKSIDKYPGRGGDEYKSAYDEVWAINSMAFFPGCEDIDRLYVMDDFEHRLPYFCNKELGESLKTYDKRIITSRVYPDWPTAERFPVEDCVKRFGLPLGIAMYSSPDWMIAHAIMDGFTSIDLFGVDNQEQASAEMSLATSKWIGVAQGAGITVNSYLGSVHQFSTNVAFAHEFGLYGYAFRPRIETLIFAPDELQEPEKCQSSTTEKVKVTTSSTKSILSKPQKKPLNLVPNHSER